jgi:hypothetical protein
VSNTYTVPVLMRCFPLRKGTAFDAIDGSSSGRSAAFDERRYRRPKNFGSLCITQRGTFDSRVCTSRKRGSSGKWLAPRWFLLEGSVTDAIDLNGGAFYPLDTPARRERVLCISA